MPDNLKNDEKHTQPVQPTEKQPDLRYFCDACTGIAFTMNEGDAYPKNPVCKVCGRPVFVIKPENFIRIK